MRNFADAELSQPFLMAVKAVRPCCKADHARPGRKRPRDSNRGIFEDHAVLDCDPELPGCMEIEVGRRFAALDMFAATVEMIAERVLEPEMSEMPGNPFGRTR